MDECNYAADYGAPLYHVTFRIFRNHPIVDPKSEVKFVTLRKSISFDSRIFLPVLVDHFYLSFNHYLFPGNNS